MDLVVLDDSEFHFDRDTLWRELGVSAGRQTLIAAFEKLTAEAREVARPRAVYRLAAFDRGGDETVTIDGTPLTSRVLWHHLDEVYRVFPFVATCGRELAVWAASKTDMMERFWADTILDRALECAGEQLSAHLVRRYGLERAGIMTPGSLEDWPIEEQRALFRILGDVEAAIGVRLNENLMMDPLHSVSGIVFPTDLDFEVCSLCPRRDCPKRSAPFEEHLYQTRYGGMVDQ